MANITRWSPFDELRSVWPSDIMGRDVFGRLRPDGGLSLEWSPRCDVTDKDDEIVVHAELPGVDPGDMDVSVREGLLTIRGEKREEKKEEEKGRTYSERFYGTFERSISVPANVDQDKIEASVKDGVLEVHLPKKEPAKPSARKIQVNTS